MGEGKQWVTANGYMVSYHGDENVLQLDSDDGCTTLWVENPLNCTLFWHEFYGMALCLLKTWILKIHILKFLMTTTGMQISPMVWWLHFLRTGFLPLWFTWHQGSFHCRSLKEVSFHPLHDSTDIWGPRIMGRPSLVSEPWLSPVLTSKYASHPANPPILTQSQSSPPPSPPPPVQQTPSLVSQSFSFL